MIMHQRWTQTDITDLRSRSLAGATVAAIAEATGRSPAMVEQMMKRLRLRAALPE